MAQMLTINKWYGGMSESDAYTGEEMCAFSDGVDGKSNPEYLRIARSSVEQFTTGNDLVTCHYDNRTYFTDSTNVYDDSGSVVFTAAGEVYNCIEFDSNLVYFYRNGANMELGRIPLINGTPDYGSADTPFIDEALAPFQAPLILPSAQEYCTAVNETNAILHFAIGKFVYTVTADTFPLVKVSLNFEEQLVAITKQGSQYYIYTQTGRKYFWDGVSEAVDGYVDLGESIKYVKDTRNYDYIVAGEGVSIYSRFYMSQGQSFQLINTASFTIDGLDQKWRHAYDTTYRFSNFLIATDQSNVYMTNEDARGIESYGNRIQGLPYGTTLEESNDEYQEFGAIRTERSGLFLTFSYRDINGNGFVRSIPYFRDRESTYTFQEQGEYITKNYVMGTLKIRQSLVYMRYETPANTAIDLYVAVDGTGQYELLKTISDDERSIKISSTDIIRQGYEFQYKLVLRTTDTSVTPKIYSIQFQYEQADR